MQYRRLGNTDLMVSTIGMGCWGLAGGFQWGSQDDAESMATVHAALDAGINFFDTAELYGQGHSEIVLGRALKGVRQQVVIATKVSSQHLAPEALVRACEASLRRLQSDWIDLLQIHWPNWDVPLAETWQALAQLQAQGKVRAIGVSNFGPIDLQTLLQLGTPASNQLPYSLLFRAVEYEVQALCMQHGISILCYSPLLHGLLSGRYTSCETFAVTRARTRHFGPRWPHIRHHEPGCEVEVNAALRALQGVSQKVGRPLAEVAVAWLLQRPAVASVIVGMRQPHHARAGARAAELVLAPAVMERLDRATAQVKARLGPNLDMWESEPRAH